MNLEIDEVENMIASLLILVRSAELNKDKMDIVTAFGEMNIKGINYQMQMSLIADKKIWMDSEGVRMQEVTKIVG